jgi:hypothetical protein
VLLAFALNDVLLYYQANHGDRLPWRSAFASVEERARERCYCGFLALIPPLLFRSAHQRLRKM